MKHTALLLLLSTVASAADPVIRERHAAVEATLSANARKADLGKHVMVLGGAGLVVSAVTAAAGAGVVAADAARGVAAFAVTPYAVALGADVPEVRPSNNAGEALLITGLVTAIVSTVVIAAGAVVKGTGGTAREKQALEYEKLVLEYQMGAERRDELREIKKTLAEPTAAPTLLPEAAPAAPHLKGPLRPGSVDAPTR